MMEVQDALQALIVEALERLTRDAGPSVSGGLNLQINGAYQFP